MKVTVPLLVIAFAFASAKAGAFQAKIDPLKLALKPANALASTDQAQPLAIAEAHARLAAAVSGCQCPFCTQMRLMNTGL